MDSFEVREISPHEQPQMDALLERGGLRRDANLDYRAGVFDGDRLIATGSCAGNTLRCLTVDPDWQGEGLLNRLVGHLIQVQFRRGQHHLFLYTKASSARFFRDLGFSEIVRDGQRTVFMENRRDGFSGYLERLRKESPEPDGGPIGGLVMNANPFTLGHQYLAEQASAACEQLHLFVVSEDASVFPAADRLALVKAGLARLPNVVYHQTDAYLISQATFPSYFLADDQAVTLAQARLDAMIFSRIAECLGIAVRFLGTEPKSAMTSLYNQVLQEVLPKAGVACSILPRLEQGGRPISASTVRRAIKDGDWDTVAAFVPPTTLDYLTSPKNEAVIQTLRGMKQVEHH